MPLEDDELDIKNAELHLAIESGDMKRVEKLLNEGADIDYTPSARGSVPPLSRACSKGNAEIAELLIMRGADIEKKDSWGETPLFFSRRHPKCTKLLLDHKANPNICSSSGWTPLTLALYYQTGIDSAKLLLDYKADPTMKNMAGKDAYTFFKSKALTPAYAKIKDLFDEAIAKQSKNGV